MLVQKRNRYNAYMNAYMKERYRRRRKEALELLGGRCVVCGSRRGLEFDHRDPKSKGRTIAAIWSYAAKRFWAEIIKCQLLCPEHHQAKSLRERGLSRAKGVHGNYQNYQRYKCRCALCRAAWNERNKVYKQRYRTKRRVKETT